MGYEEFDKAEDAALVHAWQDWCKREGVTAPDSNGAWQHGIMWDAFLEGWISGKKFSNQAVEDAHG